MLQTMVVSWLSIVGIVPLGPSWSNSYSDALQAARFSHRPLVVLLEQPTERAGQAERLRKVAPSILMRYEVCHIDATSKQGKQIAELYGATELPYTVITDSDCRQILFRGTGTLSTSLLTRTLAEYSPDKDCHSNLTSLDESRTVNGRDTLPDKQLVMVRKPVMDDRDLKLTDYQSRLIELDAPLTSSDGESAGNAFPHATLDAAESAAADSQRPMLVVVSMDHCHFCDKLKSQTLEEPVVRDEIASEFESVFIEEADHRSWVESKGVAIFPTTLIVGPGGRLIDRIEGFVSPEQLLGRLQNVRSRLLSRR